MEDTGDCQGEIYNTGKKSLYSNTFADKEVHDIIQMFLLFIPVTYFLIWICEFFKTQIWLLFANRDTAPFNYSFNWDVIFMNM